MTCQGRRVHWGKAAGAIAIGCIAAASLALSTSALAAFPGTNGQIAVYHDPAQPGSTDGIYAIDPATLALTQLTGTPANDEEPSYSADGERIVFTRFESGAQRRVWIMNADGSGQTQLASPGPTVSDFTPSFSPDGTKVIFIRDDVGVEPQLWIMNDDGSGQTQLTFDGPNDPTVDSAAFSPDGQKIVLEYDDGVAPGNRIVVVNPDGSNIQPLTSGSPSDEDPDWSPDGRQITFERGNEIWVMNADGSGQAPITDVGANFAYTPAYSPDGTRVVFVFHDSTSTFGDLRLADPNSFNQVTPLTQSAGADDYNPSWQPLNPPACDLAGSATQKSVKSISLTVTCANENAAVVAEGSGEAAKVKRAAASKKKKGFTIPAVTSQVPAGTPTTVTLSIPKKGSKALKKAMKAGKKGKATITATLTDDLGLASSETFEVTFKKKKK